MFCYRIVALCLLQNEVCPLFFNRHVLKYILGRKIGWHDLAFFDPVMYESLRQLVLDAETKDASLMFAALDLTFCVELCPEEVSHFGQSPQLCVTKGVIYLRYKRGDIFEVQKGWYICAKGVMYL